MIEKCEDDVAGSLVLGKELYSFEDGFLQVKDIVGLDGHVEHIDCSLDFLVVAVWVFGWLWHVLDGEHEIGDSFLFETERLQRFFFDFEEIQARQVFEQIPFTSTLLFSIEQLLQ